MVTVLRKFLLDRVVAFDRACDGEVFSVLEKSSFFDVEDRSRVDVHFAVTDFEMQVRAAGTAGIAAPTDELAAFDHVAHVYEALLEVAVKGARAVCMFNHHVVAVTAAVVFGNDDLSGVGGDDGVADGNMHVDAPVQAVLADAVGGV